MERYLSTEMKPGNKNVRGFLERSIVCRALLKALAVLGVSLILTDGVLTPAQSVLGAIQGSCELSYALKANLVNSIIGLTVVKPDISTGTIVGASCGILILLFLVQPLGIAKIGSTFAPIVIIWLLFNFTFGIYVSTRL